MGRLGCGEEEVKDIVRSKGVTNPSDIIAIPSPVPVCVKNQLKPHTTSVPLPPLRYQIQELGRPRFITVYVSAT